MLSYEFESQPGVIKRVSKMQICDEFFYNVIYMYTNIYHVIVIFQGSSNKFFYFKNVVVGSKSISLEYKFCE